MQQQKETLKEYENGGKIETYRGINKSTTDFEKIYNCCDYFAKQGKKTVITPKVHHKDPLYKEIYQSITGTKYDRKCPDFIVESDFYEHEGFTGNGGKRAFKNMMKRGLKQSSKIIIEDCGVTENYLKKWCYEAQKKGIFLNELWINKINEGIKQIL